MTPSSLTPGQSPVTAASHCTKVTKSYYNRVSFVARTKWKDSYQIPTLQWYSFRTPMAQAVVFRGLLCGIFLSAAFLVWLLMILSRGKFFMTFDCIGYSLRPTSGQYLSHLIFPAPSLQARTTLSHVCPTLSVLRTPELAGDTEQSCICPQHGLSSVLYLSSIRPPCNVRMSSIYPLSVWMDSVFTEWAPRPIQSISCDVRVHPAPQGARLLEAST